MGVLLPVLAKAKYQARTLIGINNQRQIVLAVNCFAMNNDECYPESIATIGFGTSSWWWAEPTMMNASKPRFSQKHLSISAYLYSYIEDATVMFCPNAPRKYKYLQQAWDEGDGWDNPQCPGKPPDPAYGVYCFYWNYTGYLEDQPYPFRGPRGPATRGRGWSKLLVSDYFGFDHWRNEYRYGTDNTDAYGSCERFKAANVTPGRLTSSDFWSRMKSDSFNLSTIDVKLHAGYTDGHVGSYSASETIPMRVSSAADGSTTRYGVGSAGIFYLPKN